MKNKTIKQEESQEQVEKRIRKKKIKEKRQKSLGPVFSGFLLSAPLFAGGFFMFKASKTAGERIDDNTFIFKAKCNDIDRYSEAFFVKPNLLNLDPINDEFRKNCQPLHYKAVKPEDCLLEYDRFKEYTVNCSLTNLENFEKRYVRGLDCSSCGMAIAPFIMMLATSMFFLYGGWIMVYVFNII